MDSALRERGSLGGAADFSLSRARERPRTDRDPFKRGGQAREENADLIAIINGAIEPSVTNGRGAILPPPPPPPLSACHTMRVPHRVVVIND